MALYRPTYEVGLADGQVVRVAIGTGDQLRAELEQTKLGLPQKAAMHLTTLWIWAALVRMGLEDRPAGAFIADPPDWDVVKGPDGEPLLTEVDPTQRVRSGSGSDSPATTVTPATG